MQALAGSVERLAHWFQGPKGLVLWAAVAALGAVTTFFVVGWVARRRGARQPKLTAATVALAVAAVGLGVVSGRLPEARAAVFHVEHQVVRVGAAITVLLFALATLGLVLPRTLDLFERGSFNNFVAARHVRSKKSGFLTIISLLSILGVAISSFALCAVISIMGGFGADLKQKILNNSAQIRVQTSATGGFDEHQAVLDRVRRIPGVIGATPVAGGEVMASSAMTTAGVILRGVDPKTIGSVIDIPAAMATSDVRLGGFEYLTDPLRLRNLPADAPIGIGQSGEIYLRGAEGSEPVATGDEGREDAYPGIVLGAELAKSLHVYVTDVLTLVSPMGDLGPSGILPRIRKFRVAGIFYSGMYEYDASHAFVALDRAQEILDMGTAVTSLDLRVHDVEGVERVTELVRRSVAESGLEVVDWKEMNRNLFSALKLEKVATFVILSIAILVASFCIICTLLLMVTEKSKEIAILKAMGASDGAVLRLFLTEGMFIGGVGTAFGVTAGLVFMTGLQKFGVRLDPDVYYVDRLPVHVDHVDYLLIAFCAFLITTLATLYPARAASRLRPVEGLRHE